MVNPLRPLWVFYLSAFLLSLLSLKEVRAQGCISARQCAPVVNMFQPQEIGEVQKEEGPYLKPEEWQIGMSYRYYNAYKHYEGNERQWHRDSLGNNVFNNMNILTLAATYGITQRLSGTFHLPLMYGQWSIPRPTNPPGTRYFQKSYGVGDASLSGHFWLLNPIRHTRENIAVGLGEKLPQVIPILNVNSRMEMARISSRDW